VNTPESVKLASEKFTAAHKEYCVAVNSAEYHTKYANEARLRLEQATEALKLAKVELDELTKVNVP
jgi:hypothetical protein